MTSQARLFLCVICLYLCGVALIASPRKREARTQKLNLEHTTSFVVYPKHTNHLGTLFGGKTLSEMDRTAGITVRRLLYASKIKRAVTARLNDVKFLSPGNVGDLLLFRGEVVDLGTSSVTVEVRVWKETGGEKKEVACGTFTFICVDDKGRTAAHGLKLEEE